MTRESKWAFYLIVQHTNWNNVLRFIYHHVLWFTPLFYSQFALSLEQTIPTQKAAMCVCVCVCLTRTHKANCEKPIFRLSISFILLSLFFGCSKRVLSFSIGNVMYIVLNASSTNQPQNFSNNIDRAKACIHIVTNKPNLSVAFQKLPNICIWKHNWK